MDYITFGLVMQLLLLAVISTRTVVYAGDNLALLSGTLRTYQKNVCDSEKISLSCPRGTSISIEIAQYDKNEKDGSYVICPLDETHIQSQKHNSNSENLPEIEIKHQTDSCQWPNSLQTKWQELEGGTWVRYSLLQTAIEACQKKTHCKFFPSPKSFEGNPCPGVRRVVTFAYKCRPYEFRSKVACENEIIQLICNPYSRIAIYSASYGRTEYESIQCAQPQGVKEETCLVSYATETVMKICHGRRRCTIAADSSTFGNPCQPNSRMYLKIVYTCVPRKVLKDLYDVQPEPDEPNQENSADLNELYDDDQFYKESEAIPPAPKLQGGISNGEEPESGNSQNLNLTAITTLQPTSISLHNERSFWFEENHELFYFYIILAVVSLLLICLIFVIIIRLVVVKRNLSAANDGKCHQQEQQSTAGSTTIQTELCESDDNNVIDMTTTTMSISSISKDDQLCNTYTPSSYGKLEPSSISYALIPTSSLVSHQPSITLGQSNTLMPSSRPISTITFHPTKHPVLINAPVIGVSTLTRQPSQNVATSFQCSTPNQRQQSSTCPSDNNATEFYYG